MFNFLRKKTWPRQTIEEIRKRSQILVIDDSDFAYKALFDKDGYTVEKWDDVDDLPKLEKRYYDIILLDIQGVGDQISNEGGMGVLKHLKQVNPTQIIIAYSNADFSLKYQEFFDMADATLSKNHDYVQFKRTVDKLLMEKFSLGFYIDHVIQYASPHTNEIAKLKKITKNALLTKDMEKLESYLQTKIENKDVITIILQIVQIGIGIAAL